MAAVAYKPKAVKDVSAEDFIKAYAAHLKSNDKIQLPTWVDVIKTATFKEMCPQDADWYYIRAASLVRRIYIRPGMGVGLFRTVYGGRVRRGAAPEHFAKASGGLVRHIFHQLESVGLVEKVSTGGRRVTANGQRDMDLIAGRITTQLQQF